MRKRNIYWLLAVVVAVILAGLGSAASAQGVPSPDAGGAWPLAGHDLGNTRDAAGEHIIGPGNASRLTTAWSVTTAGDVVPTPTVYDGTVYAPDVGGKLWAVAAGSGQVLWSHDISGYTGIAGDLSRTSPAVYGNELVLGDSSASETTLGHGAYVFAVDRHTGQLLWRTEVSTNPAAIITGSPAIYQGVAYMGVSSAEETIAATVPGYHCCTFRGSVIALDVATGRLLWRTYTVPAGYTGGAVWGSTPAINQTDNLVYVGTGNNYSAPAGVCAYPGQTGCTLPPADDHDDSVLALDRTTGAIRWFHMTLSSDVTNDACDQQPGAACGPDSDFGSGPNLFRLPSGRQVLGIGQKSGVYWELDPSTGAVIWRTVAGPPGGNGGIEWGSATDGDRIYIAEGNWDGLPYQITSADGRKSTTDGGFWVALDATTGRILWQTADPQHAADLGYVSTANGLMFVGSTAATGDDMYVLDAANGKILWRFASGGSVSSGAAIVNGTVYWGSGYYRATQCPNGTGTLKYCVVSNDKLYAFHVR